MANSSAGVEARAYQARAFRGQKDLEMLTYHDRP
jgi:hypothetical protein